MKTVEVLEKILDGARLAVFHNLDPLKTEFLRDKEIPALHEAIAWAKVLEVMDYRHALSRSSLGWFLTDLKDGTFLHGATITELADKPK